MLLIERSPHLFFLIIEFSLLHISFMNQLEADLVELLINHPYNNFVQNHQVDHTMT